MSGEQRPRPGGDALDDGIDDERWQLLREAVGAAHKGDGTAARIATLRLARHVPYDAQPSTCIWWLLRYRIGQLLGRKPSGDDLAQIADSRKERFSTVVADEGMLEKVLLTVSKLAPAEREIAGGEFLVAGIAALGVLLDDPEIDMDEVRRDLARWWRQNLDKFRAQGLLEDRSGGGGRLNVSLTGATYSGS